MIGRICGTGSYIPSHRMDNVELSSLVDTSDEWIRERTGIQSRHLAKQETVSFMAAKAAEEALADSGLKAEEIDLILVATSSSETVFPNTSCEVQKAIGAVHAWGYDLNAACSGFILALNTAQSYIRSDLVKTALVIGAEKMSRIVDWKDRGTCILFGDGAGAVVLRGEESESAEAVYTAMAHSAGDKGEALTLQYGTEETPVIRMDGQAVFKFAVRKVPEIIEEMLKKADVSREDVDYFVLHQANRRIIEAAAKRVGVEIEKFPMNLGEYANTSAASVPILLNEMNRDGKLKRGQKIILAGFGAGLTWAGCLMEWYSFPSYVDRLRLIRLRGQKSQRAGHHR